jgi:hypothetical protein
MEVEFSRHSRLHALHLILVSSSFVLPSHAAPTTTMPAGLSQAAMISVTMLAHSLRRFTLAAGTLAALAGCASIISGRRADVAFDTYPANAHVAIHDDRGRQVTSLYTPGLATLKRQGRFFMPGKYVATISAPGYQTAQVPIGSTLNPWILGNIVIGGIPGLVIDGATGAAWKPTRSEIHRQLQPIEEEHWSRGDVE